MNFMTAFLCVLFSNLPNIFAFLAMICVTTVIVIIAVMATISTQKIRTNPEGFAILEKHAIKCVLLFALLTFLFLGLSLFCPSLDQIKRHQESKRTSVEKVENIGLTKTLDALEKKEKERDNSLR